MAQHAQAYTAMMDTVNSGQPIDFFLNSIQKDKPAFYNAAMALVDVVDCIRRVDNVVLRTPEDKDVDGFLASSRAAMATRMAVCLNTGDMASACLYASGLGSAVVQQSKGRKFNCEAPAKPEPLEMKIVGMPERTVTSSVKYNSNGDIQSTSTTEKDTAPA